MVLIANNQYAYSTPAARQFACRSLADRAAGYGMLSHTVPGNDLKACLEVVGAAVAAARAGGGPQFVLADLLRLCGHGEHDDALYIDPDLKNSPLGRDCLQEGEKYLLEKEWANSSDLRKWQIEIIQTIDRVISQVQREPAPDPSHEDWTALNCKSLQEGQP